MKSKTNISIKDLRGVRVTPSIELGNNVGYPSGDLLDANATLELVTKKIIELINGADSSFDTLKELEDYVKQLNSYLQSLERKLNNLENTVNSLDSKYVTISNFNDTVDKLNKAIEELKAKINDLLSDSEQNNSNRTIVTNEVYAGNVYEDNPIWSNVATTSGLKDQWMKEGELVALVIGDEIIAVNTVHLYLNILYAGDHNPNKKYVGNTQPSFLIYQAGSEIHYAINSEYLPENGSVGISFITL